MLPANVRPLSSRGRARYTDDSMEQSVDEQALQPLWQAVEADPQVGPGWLAALRSQAGRLLCSACLGTRGELPGAVLAGCRRGPSQRRTSSSAWSLCG